MKHSFFIVGFVTFCFSCSKPKNDQENPVVPPPSSEAFTLVKSTTYLDQNISSPQTNYLFSEFILKSGKKPGVMRHMVFSFPGLTQANINLLKNITFKVTGVSTPSPAMNPTLGENTTASPNLNVDPNATVRIEMRGDILSGFQASKKPVLKVFYTQDGVQKETDTASGQTITVGSGSLTASVSSSTPLAGITTGNQVVETLRLDVNGNNSTANYFEVGLQDHKGVEEISLFLDSTTFLGSTTNVLPKSKVNVSLPILDTSIKKLSVKLKLKAITSGEKSQTGIKTSITKIGYTTSFGEVKTYDVTLWGNDIVAFKAYPLIELVPVSSVMDTTQRQRLIGIKITAVGGPVSFKQFAVKPVLQDNGIHDDVLKIKDLGIEMIGNAGLTQPSYVAHSDQTAFQVSEITESTTIWWVTFATGNQELVIQKGESIIIYLLGRFSGYAHRASDGDAAGIGLYVDALSAQTPHRYVNNGVMGSKTAKLYSSSITNSAAVPFYIVWSDMSAPNHDSHFGVSTDDHFNSARLSIPLGTSVLYRAGGSHNGALTTQLVMFE